MCSTVSPQAVIFAHCDGFAPNFNNLIGAIRRPSLLNRADERCVFVRLQKCEDSRRDRTPHTTNAPSQSSAPNGSPAWIDQRLIMETIRLWQPYYSQILTADDALEMLTNAGHLFDALGHSTPAESGVRP